MNENNLNEENDKINNTMTSWNYLGFLILFLIPMILTFICLFYFKCDTNLRYYYTDKIDMNCFYIIITIAIINIIITAIFSFKGNNISKKNFAKSFMIFAFLILIIEICSIGKFMSLNDYEEEVKYYALNIIKDNENSNYLYEIGHVSKSNLEKILDEIYKNPEEYSFLNCDIENIRKEIENDRYKLKSSKKQYFTLRIAGYINGVTITEVDE